jgi:ubiquinone/menaquinone biosynthesis C-methylase UbiE
MTATAEIKALKKAHRKTWASEVLDVAAGTGKLT